MLQLFFDFYGIMKFSQMFYEYLETDDSIILASVEPLSYDSSLLQYFTFYFAKYRGPCLILALVCVKWPKQVIDEKFYNILCNFLHKLRVVQRGLLYDKNLRVSSTTNKTISEGKRVNIF